MEKKIKEYEEFIAKATHMSLSEVERRKLIKYHREMVGNFQHERMIHLIIMLFFVAVTLVLIGLLLWLSYYLGLVLFLTPFYLMVFIVTTLTIFYVKHYYFLENHIQGLYKYTELLYNSNKSGKNP